MDPNINRAVKQFRLNILFEINEAPELNRLPYKEVW